MKVQQKGVKAHVEIEVQEGLAPAKQQEALQEHEWIVHSRATEWLMPNKSNVQVPSMFGTPDKTIAKICDEFCIVHCEGKCTCKDGTKCGKNNPPPEVSVA